MRLTGQLLAWEYLRRNIDYQADWRHRYQMPPEDLASRWHLEILEDPTLDAQTARPVWRLAPGRRVTLQVAREAAEDAQRFSLWDISGTKRLVHDGTRVLLSGFTDSEMMHLALSQDMHDGAPFDYVLSQSVHAEEAVRRLAIKRRLLGGQVVASPSVAPRPDRLALFHMRALQAFDGRNAGASLREIAKHLFGGEVVEKNWHPDSEMRAQVRHLIRRASTLVAGEYRKLIGPTSSTGR